MNYKDIDNLISEGEGFRLEFKRKVSSSQKIARALIALANTSGGKILFGVDDDGTVVGVESEKSEVEEILHAGKYFADPPIEPIIEIIPYKGKDVIVAHVEESKIKPHYLFEDDETDDGHEKVYIRVNDKTLAASKEVVKILQAEDPEAAPLRISIGDRERHLFDYLEKNEKITVKQYAKAVNISFRRASRSLIQLVRAGVLRIHTNEKEDYYTMSTDQIR